MKYLIEPRAIPMPFAAKDAKRTPTASFDSEKIYKVGNREFFDRTFSVPFFNGGNVITRHELNAFGYNATKFGFVEQCGFVPTFNIDVCRQIGGYPKGAVLYWFVLDGNHEITCDVRRVISLQPNNFHNFAWDAEKNPDPYVPGASDDDGNVWWKVLDESDGCDENRTYPSFESHDEYNPEEETLDFHAWHYVSVVWPKWDANLFNTEYSDEIQEQFYRVIMGKCVIIYAQTEDSGTRGVEYKCGRLSWADGPRCGMVVFGRPRVDVVSTNWNNPTAGNKWWIENYWPEIKIYKLGNKPL